MNFSLHFSGEYKCAFCPTGLFSLEAFKNHLNKQHSKCTGCGLKFNSYERLETHEGFCLQSIKAKKAQRFQRDEGFGTIKEELQDLNVSESEIKVCELTNEDYHDIYFNNDQDPTNTAEMSGVKKRDDQQNSTINLNDNQIHEKPVTIIINDDDGAIILDDVNEEALQSIRGKFAIFPFYKQKE